MIDTGDLNYTVRHLNTKVLLNKINHSQTKTFMKIIVPVRYSPIALFISNVNFNLFYPFHLCMNEGSITTNYKWVTKLLYLLYNE